VDRESGTRNLELGMDGQTSMSNSLHSQFLVPDSQLLVPLFRKVIVNSATNPTLLNRFSLIFIIHFICLQAAVLAQVPYTRLTVEDGLSNNSVQCLLQDKNGIVWIGTNGGLNRYDGALFIQYNLLSQPSLSSSAITALIEDNDGNIWVGTDNGINILNPINNTIRQLLHRKNDPGSLPPGPVKSIQKMKDGSIWVMSETWFAKYRQPDSFLPIAMDPSLVGLTRVFTGIAEGEAGQAWISYLDHPTRMVRKLKQPNGRDSIADLDAVWPDYSRVYTDADHTNWGISHTGVTRFSSDAQNYERWLINKASANLPSLHLPICYTTDANGIVWQGSQAINLARFDLRQKTVTDYNWLLQACKASMVYCLYSDRSNTIWIGTDNGIIKLSNRTSFFRNIPFTLREKEIKNVRCRRIIEDKYGVLYAGTENYGLLKLVPGAGGNYTTIPLSTYGAIDISSVPVNGNMITVPSKGEYDIGYMYDMWYDNNNTIWLSGFGLLKYDIPSSTMVIYLAGKEPEERAQSITQFSICYDDSLIWTGGQHNLFTFDMDKHSLLPFYDNKGNMPFHEIPCWSLAKTGKWIWAGTDKGLYKINSATKEVTRQDKHPALQLTINDIFVDKDNSLWISTAGGGILHYNSDDEQVIQYTTRDGLSNNTVCGTLADDDNNLWISTYAGLNYLNRQTSQFASFYSKDALNGDEFNRKAFARLRNGDLVFGGLNGYNIFNTKDAFIDYKPASLLLTSFSKTTADGVVMETIFDAGKTSAITIDPGDKFISFTFTLTDMYDPASNRYSYKLEGLDNEWHYIGNQHTLSFMSLAPGKYTLRIKGFSAKYLVTKNELAISIKVNQVFYKTAWFIILVVLATAALVAGIVHYRIRHLQKLQVLRTRIASDLHDEVGSNLVRISMLADASKRESDDGKLSQQFGLIAGISRAAASTIRDVIWNIDARNDSMGDMINYMHEHIHNMLNPAGIEFSFQHADVNGDKKLHINFRQNVYLIFKEAINNIVKHSGADYVQVSLEQKRGLFTMMIKDNGKGMTEKNLSTGQGLHNMKMRATRIGAAIEIISGEGVIVLLKAPV
jgi:signal transduction histidine kinase/ligand-binding sensor domain-containing protein